MERYDYLRAIKEDVLNYINENNIVVTSENRDEVEQDLNDTLFTYDSVTGNASGSYTFNTWTAEEYLCHNWELLGEALTEFGCDMSYLEKGAEACDVTIRCYLLGQAIGRNRNRRRRIKRAYARKSLYRKTSCKLMVLKTNNEQLKKYLQL